MVSFPPAVLFFCLCQYIWTDQIFLNLGQQYCHLFSSVIVPSSGKPPLPLRKAEMTSVARVPVTTGMDVPPPRTQSPPWGWHTGSESKNVPFCSGDAEAVVHVGACQRPPRWLFPCHVKWHVCKRSQAELWQDYLPNSYCPHNKQSLVGDGNVLS